MVLLSSIECFSGLPVAILEQFERTGHAANPPNDATIFAQGEPADAVYAVIGGDGQIRIGSSTANSKSLMVELLGTGEIFGEMGVIDGGVRSAEAVVIGRVQLWRIGAAVFRDVLDTTPALGTALTRMLTRRLRRTYTLLQDATFATVEARLARQVLYLAGLNGQQTARGIRIPGRFRQPDLADMLGASLRSVITVLNSWRAEGLVLYDTNSARLTICRLDALRERAEPRIG